MKLNKLLKNNTFLINSGACIVLLLAVCYFGLNSPIKETYSADTCNGNLVMTEDGPVCEQLNYLSGKWKWKDGEITFPGNDNGVISINWGTYSSGFLQTRADDVIVYANDNGLLKDYKLNFTSNGVSYQSFAIGSMYIDGSTNYIYYDTSYTQPIQNSELAKVYPYLYDNSSDGRTRVMTLDYKTPTWENDSYKIIDFGSTPQSVPEDFYNWFTANASLMKVSKCYYNGSKFIWTDLYMDTYDMYSNFITEDSCVNASVKLTIKDEYSNVQDCTSGTCGNKQNEVTLNLAPGTYQLNDTQALKYNLSRNGFKLIKWMIKSYNNGTQYGSGFSLVDVDKEFTFNEGIYQLTILAQWAPLETYNITFDANGGTGAPSALTKTEGTDITLPVTEPIRDGFTFAGWNTLSDGTGTSFESGQKYSIEGDKTLYAKWIKNYEIAGSYSVDETNKRIIVNVNTLKTEFENNVKLTQGYKINTETKIVNDKEVLYTGGKVQIKKADDSLYVEYLIIVSGDLNGTGTIDTEDYAKIYSYFQESYEFKDLEEMAADYNEDGIITTEDYAKIYSYWKEEE